MQFPEIITLFKGPLDGYEVNYFGAKFLKTIQYGYEYTYEVILIKPRKGKIRFLGVYNGRIKSKL